MVEAQAKRTWPVLLAVLLCVAGFNLGQFENGFVHDDLPMLRAGLIKDPSRIGEVFASHALVAHGPSQVLPMDTYRPLSILTFFWDAWLSGESAWSYHLTNLLLHLACVACVFAWIRLLVPRASLWVVASASLFFGLSPQLAEAHVWINGRSDPLATLFGLSSFLLWQRTRTLAGSRRLAAAVLVGSLFLCGLLSKEILLFTLPALLFWPNPERTSLSVRLRRTAPFMVAAAIYLLLRTWALSGLRSSRDTTQLREALHNLPVLWLDGAQELLWPTQLYLRGLREEYAALTAAQYAGGVALVLAIAALSFVGRTRLPVLCWSLSFYALSLAPAALISAVLWPGFGRYLYLPCAGLAVGLAEALALAQSKLTVVTPSHVRPWLQGALATACAAYLIFFGLRLVRYTRDYVDERSLYAAAIRHAPERANGYGRMASLLTTEGKIAEALTLYRKAMSHDPSEPSYALQAIFWSLKTGQIQAAEQLARTAIVSTPEPQAGAFRALLIRALVERDAQAAVTELCTCLALEPVPAPCLEAPRFMLDPRGAHYQELRAALVQFAQTCASKTAQAALAQRLRTQTSATSQ